MVKGYPEMTSRRGGRSTAAFTLMELLVVIAIMAILAALIVGLAGVSGDKKVISRTTAEMNRLVTLIEAYRHRIGQYPPDTGMAETNTLYYELAGSTNTGNGAFGLRLGGSVSVTTLQNVFGLSGLVNAVQIDKTAPVIDPENKVQGAHVSWLLTSVRPDEVASLAPDTLSLVVAADDPNGNRPNPWRYRSPGIHNPNGFDLWAEVKLRSGKRVIGNWKE